MSTSGDSRRIGRLEKQIEKLSSDMQIMKSLMSELLAACKKGFSMSEHTLSSLRKILTLVQSTEAEKKRGPFHPEACIQPGFPSVLIPTPVISSGSPREYSLNSPASVPRPQWTPAIRFPSPLVSAAERQRKSTFYALRSSRIYHSQESHLGIESTPTALSKEPAYECIIVNNRHTPTASTFCSAHGVLSPIMSLGSVLSCLVTWPTLKECTVHQNSNELVVEGGKLRPDPEPPPLNPPLL